MPSTFTEWLIIVLIGLLFAKDYVLPAILKKFGLNWKNGTNGNGTTEHRIKDLENHADVANREMGEIRKDISDIKSDLSFIRGKMDT